MDHVLNCCPWSCCLTLLPLPASSSVFFFFFNDPAPTVIYTLSLHDALPILSAVSPRRFSRIDSCTCRNLRDSVPISPRSEEHRLNSSHTVISYAVFCLK